MSPLARRALSLVRFAFILILPLAFTRAVHADTWTSGQEITNPQSFWGDDNDTPPNPAALLIANNFNSVYAATGDLLYVGAPGGYQLIFTRAETLLLYLPTAGPVGPLDATLVDPMSTSAGSFGGEVTALQLNVDFSSAGLLGSSSVPFGNLVLTGFDGSLSSLNGQTVSQFLGDVSVLLGGGSSIYTIDQLDNASDSIIVDLNTSFSNGNPSPWADEHLTLPTGTTGGGGGGTTSMPEPSSVVLLGAGLLGILGLAKFKA